MENMYWILGSDYDPYAPIDLASYADQELTIGHNEIATKDSHPLCEWIIDTKVDHEVNVEFKRSWHNYEDVFVEATTTTGWSFYDSKQLTDCSSEEFVLVLYNTTQVKIRSKILSDESNLRIKISQKPILIPYLKWPRALIKIWLSIFFLSLGVSLTWTICKTVWCSRKKRRFVKLKDPNKDTDKYNETYA